MLNEEYYDEDIVDNSVDECGDLADKEIRDARLLSLLTDAEKYRQQRAYGIEAQLLAHALKLKPDDPMIWNKLGRAHRAAGFLDKALECYEKALEMNREDPWAFGNIGAVYIAKEDFAKACDFYAKAVQLAELNQQQNDQDYAVILANYAFALGKNGDKRQAAKLLKEAEKLGYTGGAAVRKQLKLSIFDRLF